MITNHQLQTFLAVVHAGSITKAARDLNAKQPAVSLQLNALRRFFGPPLFERPGGRFHLTPAGEKLRRYAEDVLGGLRTLQQDMAALQGSLSGPLVVGFTYVLSRYVMPRALSGFLERFPGVEVEIHVEVPEPMFGGLIRNSLDVICYISVPTASGITVEKLCDEPFAVVVSPDHALARRRRVTPEELAAYPFIAPASPSLKTLVESKLRSAGVAPRVVAEARHADAIKKLVECGAAYSVLIQSAIAEELSSGRLVALKLDGPPMVAELVAAYRSCPVASMLIREFIGFIRAELLTRNTGAAETPRHAAHAESPARPGRPQRGPQPRSLSGVKTRSSRAGRRRSSS